MKLRELWWILTLFGVALASGMLPALAIVLFGERCREWGAVPWGILLGVLAILPLFVYFAVREIFLRRNDRALKLLQSAAGIDIALRARVGDNGLEVIPIVCQNCDNDSFRMMGNAEEDVYEVECVACGTKKKLLDSEELWEECDTDCISCFNCDAETFNLRIAPTRRKNGDIGLVVLGCRCTVCRQISITDWNLRGPTADIERNI